MKRQTKKQQENYVWLSYSDLSTGLMISFILIFVVMNKNNKDYIDEAIEPVVKAREAFNKVNENVVKIVTAKGVCVGAVITSLEHQPDTIRINFNGEKRSWFDVDRSVIKKHAEKCVKGFGQEWLKQMYSENQNQQVKIHNLIIEGHASSDGGYYHNLGLSQERAYQTSKFILQNTSSRDVGYNWRFDSWKRTTLSANGRGESQLIYIPKYKSKKDSKFCLENTVKNEKCIEDKEGSKRVEFKYTLTHDYKKYDEVRKKYSKN